MAENESFRFKELTGGEEIAGKEGALVILSQELNLSFATQLRIRGAVQYNRVGWLVWRVCARARVGVFFFAWMAV